MNREELLKNAKPILFNTEMVQAILDGRKTVTRRVVKPQPRAMLQCVIKHECDGGAYWSDDNNVLSDTTLYKSFEVGDILYVRETWLKADDGFYYKAGFKDTEGLMKAYGFKWHPSIHMPKTAARIFLKVKDVRVERLKNITVEQIEKEGINFSPSILIDFHRLWDSTIKKQGIDKYGWEANPWVWVIEFERCEKPEVEE